MRPACQINVLPLSLGIYNHPWSNPLTLPSRKIYEIFFFLVFPAHLPKSFPNQRFASNIDTSAQRITSEAGKLVLVPQIIGFSSCFSVFLSLQSQAVFVLRAPRGAVDTRSGVSPFGRPSRLQPHLPEALIPPRSLVTGLTLRVSLV